MKIYIKTIFFVLIVLILKNDIVNGSPENYKDEDYRIKNDVKPTKYTISLTLSNNFGTDATFKGKVEILIQPTENKTEKDIKLHYKMITLTKVEITTADNDATNITKNMTTDETLEMITIGIATPLDINKTYKIYIEYSGILHDDMYGFYRSHYIDDNGFAQWIATTQFQPTHARRAFPCFDEPEYKAIFAIDITHPKEYHALSNGVALPVSKVDDDTVKTSFNRTPKMSTYIIAFLVSKYAKIEQTVDAIKHGLLSPVETIGSGQYGFSIAPKLLKVMEDFTKVSYGVSKIAKLDQVAIPDFSAGAMENWGLVTYRETALLWNEKNSSLKNKERVASVVAHELAHMWFGNLITLKWWEDTWLNEGFARYFQYYATAKVEDTWQLDNQFVAEQQQTVFIQDSTEGVQALHSKVFTPTQISGKFGSISYNKGASVIRMMEHFLGHDNFIKGLEEYFKVDNRYGSTTPEKLWTAMSKNIAVVKPPLPANTLKELMDNWIKQGGYPVVHVTLQDDKFVNFTQERFFFEKPNITNTDNWYIPISYTTTKEKNFISTSPKLWLKPSSSHKIMFNDSWIIVNIQETAYFRVKYDDALYEGIQTALKTKDFDNIHVLNRAQLVDDTMNLARASYITYTRALDIASYLSSEVEYYPWNSAFNAFAFLKRRTDSNSEVSKHLDSYILNLMKTVYENVTYDEHMTNQIDNHKKALVLNWACLLEHTDCINKTRSDYTLLSKKNVEVDPNIRPIVYCTELRNADSRTSWDHLWDRFRHSRWAPESVTLLTALGCTKDRTLLAEYLQKSVDPHSGIRDQDTVSVFTAVISGNPVGVAVGLEFLKSSFKDIIVHYGSMNALSSVITSLADRLTTKEQIDDLEKFVKENRDDLKEAAAVADSAILAARQNIVWFQKHEQELLEYLKKATSKNNGISTYSSGLLITIVIFIIRLC